MFGKPIFLNMNQESREISLPNLQKGPLHQWRVPVHKLADQIVERTEVGI
jgi:hypothetical protein